MNTSRISTLALLLLVCPAVAQQATPQPSAQELQSLEYILGVNRNTMQLKVELRLDREVYFAGEMAELTVTVTNPTSSALLVEKPLAVGSGDVELDVQKGGHFEIVPQKTMEGFIIVGAAPTLHAILETRSPSWKSRLKSRLQPELAAPL
jgi:hypothetical protein